MSDLPMTVAPGCDDLRFAVVLERQPHQVRSFYAAGHTIPAGNPPEPVGPGTELCGILIWASALSGEEFDRLVMDDGRVVKCDAVWLLYESETELKIDQGVEALLERFEAAGITEVIDPGRLDVVADEPDDD